MFKHALVKTTKAHAGWIKLARHTVDIVMLLYATDLHETYWCLMPVEVEQIWTTVWTRVHKERVLKNAVEVSKHLDDHWGGSIHLSRLEQIGGCRWTTIDYPKHHAFAIHSQPKCWKPNRLQWAWPCQLCCTRNVFRMGGTKADQEELQCHDLELTENIWKPFKVLSTITYHAWPCTG